jgi:ABC-type polar amino acid transport system ATPase subunit
MHPSRLTLTELQSASSETPNARVQMERVGVRLGGRRLLSDVSLSVAPGECVSVVGPSGAGKTTLLRCINFLVPYQEGRVYVDGVLVGYREGQDGLTRSKQKDLDALRSTIGFVFQRYNLFPNRTVLQNCIEGPTRVLGKGRDEAVDSARSALELVGMAEMVDRYPGQLSGGEQQRVAIARTLCMQPRVILFDEVTSALDPERVREVEVVMRDLAATGATMIVVTHIMRFARQSSNRIIFMENGSVGADLSSEEFFDSPPTSRIGRFVDLISDKF